MSDAAIVASGSVVPTKVVCPRCHTEVKITDYFCYNCGKELKPKPLSTSFSAQVLLYLKCVLLPPLGIIWGIKYLRQVDRNSKTVGLVCIGLTVVVLVLVVQVAINTANSFNTALNSQLQNIQGF